VKKTGEEDEGSEEDGRRRKKGTKYGEAVSDKEHEVGGDGPDSQSAHVLAIHIVDVRLEGLKIERRGEETNGEKRGEGGIRRRRRRGGRSTTRACRKDPRRYSAKLKYEKK